MTDDSQATRIAHSGIDQLMRGVDTVAPGEGLADKLELGRPLRVKLGLDPTAPAVTLGWAVVLRKLRHFQEQGHTAVLIVGDFTAQVGDPSGKTAMRKRLSREEVQGYADSLLEQFSKILLPENLEIRYNSEWLSTFDMYGMLELTSKATVAQMLERSDFANRYDAGSPISVMEFMYPLLQGYDSVAVEADIELGGTDQLWNLMMGRVIQQRYGAEPQVAVTMPLLIGTDGTEKMSQSLGNYIGITESPEEMFGKTMSIPDPLMAQWFELATELPIEQVAEVRAGLGDGSLHPGEVKRRLARSIIALYHSAEAAATAEDAFDQVFRRGAVPDEVDEYPLPTEDPISLPHLINAAGLAKSVGEARRLLDQGAVKIDGNKLVSADHDRTGLEGKVLQVGKRRFVRLVP
jgi:tyrosyl-tRNA synthetase